MKVKKEIAADRPQKTLLDFFQPKPATSRAPTTGAAVATPVKAAPCPSTAEKKEVVAASPLASDGGLSAAKSSLSAPAPPTRSPSASSTSSEDITVGALLGHTHAIVEPAGPCEDKEDDTSCLSARGRQLEALYRCPASLSPPRPRCAPVLAKRRRSRTPPPPPAKRLQQTCLDFGQSSLTVATTCPRCGMLYSDLAEEDVQLHRKFCRERRAGRASTATSTGGRGEGGTAAAEREAALTSAAPCRLLEQVDAHFARARPHGQAKQRPKKQPAEAEQDGRSSAHSTSAVCVKVRAPLQHRLCAYVLRCGAAGLCEHPAMITLVELLGFYDAVLDAAEYCVVCVCDEAARLLLCAVAGRPRTREQDPALVLTAEQCCCVRQHFTFCDVNYLYCAPGRAVARAQLQQQQALLPLRPQQARSLLFAPGAAAAQQQASVAAAAAVLAQALQWCLRTLGCHLLYGHALSPVADLSYAADLFVSHGGAPAAISPAVLQQCVGAEGVGEGGQEERGALCVHSGDVGEWASASSGREGSVLTGSMKGKDEGEEEDDNAMDRLSVVSYD